MEEALCDSIVVATALGTHARAYVVMAYQRLELLAGILAPAVRVKDEL
jgi:hypothetical protein